MSHPYAVSVRERCSTSEIPGRFPEAGIGEIAEALGGTAGDDPWGGLRDAMAALSTQALGERLLDVVLVEPPIPAYCESLVRAMQSDATAPWREHEVMKDRVWLWYAHSILHRSLPDQWPPPSVERVSLEATMTVEGARPPGKRSSLRERASFVGRLLAARDGDNPLKGAFEDETWFFDVVWHAAVTGRTKVDGGPRFTVSLDAWVPAQWLGDLAAGDAWVANAHTG